VERGGIMKDAYYFSHDSNAHVDPRIVDLLMDLKAEGYGVYWVILEMMRNEQLYQLCINDYNAIAYQAHSTPDVVEKVVLNYGLFTVSEEGFFWSNSLKKRMEHLDAKRSILSTNAKKRWYNAKAVQKNEPSESIKVNKSKVNKSKEYTCPPIQTAFKKPTLEEIREYCNSRSNGVNVEKFFDFYTANGWVQGRNKPIKNWQACVRTWENKDKKAESYENHL